MRNRRPTTSTSPVFQADTGPMLNITPSRPRWLVTRARGIFYSFANGFWRLKRFSAARADAAPVAIRRLCRPAPFLSIGLENWGVPCDALPPSTSKPSLRLTRSYEWKTALDLRMIPQSFTTRTCQSYTFNYNHVKGRKKILLTHSSSAPIRKSSPTPSSSTRLSSRPARRCLDGLRCMHLQLSTRHLLSEHETLTEQRPIAKVQTRPAFLIASIPWSFSRHVT